MSESGQRVSIRAHFERFPATVKGAFVLRGADRDPHQVVIREARVSAASGAPAGALDLRGVTFDVAPGRDFFVPFEFPVVELVPGWYGLEADVEIDGSPEAVRPGRRFTVAWPRGSARRGTIPIGTTTALEGGPKVSLEQLDCATDSVRLQFSAEEAVNMLLVADGDRLPTLDEAFDPQTGKGRLTAYPLLKVHGTLRIEVRRPGRTRSEPAVVEVSLP